MWRAARFTSSYADPLTDDESDENDFEDGLDFNNQSGDEDIPGIRRRLSNEAEVARVGEALNQTLEPDRNETASREHFSPVQVRFPVNAPPLRPPVEDRSEADNMPDPIPPVVEFELENGQDGAKASELGRQIKVEFSSSDIRFWFAELEAEMTMASIKSQWMKKT